jgi:y4mF family transcriptional regulator
MRNSLEQIGDIIRKRREILGLLQPQLSEISGVSRRTIQLIENGKANPSLETLLKIAEVLGMEFHLEIKDSPNLKEE